MDGWCLEGVGANGDSVMLPLLRFPFVVGRDPTCDLAIASVETSRHHARFEQDVGGRLRLTDLDSGNGTFVNRVPIQGSTLLDDGDVLHFGVTEYRLRHADARMLALMAPTNDLKTVLVGRTSALSEHFLVEEHAFTRMLQSRDVAVAMQPIVRVSDGCLRAFEVLGRGCVAGLPDGPVALFALAMRLGREAELSELFRWAGVSAAASFAPSTTLFVNAHPNEMFKEPFYRSIALLRAMLPSASLVVEVHESAVTRVADMRTMATRLAAWDVQFAYDDFGAGQARLLELAEAPPHFVKFDMALIRGIDRATHAKRQLVGQLVHIVHDVGATALAEGVETAAEAACCVAMGFDLIQGFLTGRPAMGDALRAYPPDYASPELIAVTTALRAQPSRD